VFVMFVFTLPEMETFNPAAGNDIYFIRAEKMTSSKIARDGTGFNGHHQSSGYGLFFFFCWRSPTWQLTLDTRVLVCYFICPRRSNPPHLNTAVDCSRTYMRILLCGLNFGPPSGSALYFSFSVAQQRRDSLLAVEHCECACDILLTSI